MLHFVIFLKLIFHKNEKDKKVNDLQDVHVPKYHMLHRI